MIKIKKTNYTIYALRYALCLLILTTTAAATIRYVSPTGNNIPPYLSWEDAANSIQDAIDVCEAGDTVLVDNGIYIENLIINTSISLIGLSMDSTVIDGRGWGDNTISVYADFTMENFNLYGKGNALGDAAIRNFQAINLLTIKNCKISEAFIGIGWVSILMTSSYTSENILFKNLTTGLGLSGNGDNSISNCIMILNNQNSSGIIIGSFSDGTYHITNNTILFTGTNNPGSGISVGAVKQVHIYNNLISGFRRGIHFDTVLDTAYVKNNIFTYSRGFRSSYNIVFTNNDIFSNNIVAIEELESNFIRTGYNLFWKNILDLDGLNYGDSDRVADPMFVNDTIPTANGNYDFHLQAFSPGIDAGDPNILDVDGSRSDIGLYGGPLGQSYKYIDLPPRTPVNLSAVLDTNQILLKWNRNSEADTSHYNVYRDTVSNFTIDSTKLVSSQADTFFIQHAPFQSSQYVYKITCVDNQGNESLPSAEVVVDITSIDEYPLVINDYILYQNYPNPFNPSTKIGYKLKDRGYVKLMVYDITGSLVSVLVNKEQEAGYYEVEFNVGNGLPSVPNNRILSSGIYLYRIEIIGEGRIPVYTDMKKMILIK